MPTPIKTILSAEKAIKRFAGDDYTINIRMHRFAMHSGLGPTQSEVWRVDLITEDRISAQAGPATLDRCVEAVRRAVVRERIARMRKARKDAIHVAAN